MKMAQATNRVTVSRKYSDYFIVRPTVRITTGELHVCSIRMIKGNSPVTLNTIKKSYFPVRYSPDVVQCLVSWQQVKAPIDPRTRSLH